VTVRRAELICAARRSDAHACMDDSIFRTLQMMAAGIDGLKVK
jgi:hypothetical protein